MKKTLLIVAVASIALTSCMSRISPGYAGFKINYAGDYRGTDSLPLETGWVGYRPGFTTVIQFPTSMQHVIYSESKDEGAEPGQQIIVGLKGGSSFNLDIGLNYTISAHKAAHIYFKFKTNDMDVINAGYLRNTTRKVLNDLAGDWTMDDLLNNRPVFERTAETQLAKLLAVDGFELNQLTILKTPTATDPNLEASIIAKIKAKQDAERKQTELQSSVADAAKKMADARGDSAKEVIEASGKAVANSKLETSLDPALLHKMWIDKWNGVLPTYMTGGQNNMLMELPAQK